VHGGPTVRHGAVRVGRVPGKSGAAPVRQGAKANRGYQVVDPADSLHGGRWQLSTG
jgi:hypothetical protein